MPSDQVVIEVTPRGRVWHVEVDESPLLILQSKETAIAEAQVRAVTSQSSRIVVYTGAGDVEQEATWPIQPAQPVQALPNGVPAVPHRPWSAVA